MLVDANILLFAVSRTSPFHGPANAWLTAALNGGQRVGVPWLSILAFLRLSTNPRAYRRPFSGPQAAKRVREWLAADVVWIPEPTSDHLDVLASLIETHHLTSDLMNDAHLAALAVEHGLTVVSADTDFARFSEIRWENPLSSP
ncbi:MAG: TA system VapC family ribonuclease toxin [Actinomycetota bacterium]